jgi:hypothetical protein
MHTKLDIYFFIIGTSYTPIRANGYNEMKHCINQERYNLKNKA